MKNFLVVLPIMFNFAVLLKKNKHGNYHDSDYNS